MEWLKSKIDKALKEMSKEDILMMTAGHIPNEMLDESIPSTDGWNGWKPINSIIKDEDINNFENDISIKLPKSYREYLKYKHFYNLRLPDIAVNLPSHLPDKNLSTLREFVYKTHNPEFIIGRGYFYFADFHDYGLLCFDTNEYVEDNEYRVVFIDHEGLNEIHYYARNFREIIEADSEFGNDFIDKLNHYNS